MKLSLDNLTLTLAEAFLAGPWNEEELIRRGRSLVGRSQWRQVAVCASSAMATYRKKPWDRPRELAATMRLALSPARRIAPIAVQVPPRAVRWPVRELPDLAAVAAFAELAPSELQWYADLRGMERRVTDERLRHYLYTWRPSRNRPARLIEAPKDRLKLIQRRILRDVLSLVPVSPIAHGYVPGRSAITAADVHIGAEILVQVDLTSFFPSIGYARVRAIFEALGYPTNVARDLAGLTTNSTPSAVLRTRPASGTSWPGSFLADRRLAVPHLPQGAPTSPALANLACFGLDRRLAGLASAFDARVTRYADDITFSGGFWLRSGRRDLLVMLRKILAEEGFSLAQAKTRVTTGSGRQQVLGVVVNEKRSLDRRALELLEATLTNCVRTGPPLQNRAGHPDFRAHLLGRLAWVHLAAPHKYDRLRLIFDRIDWS